ncbi:MAG: hypothetical protein BWY71_01296 [Planctomycetes bacterium ADurb.Bin412]|nr:MAG: hypothetical protein BWY71_01296 [Planctomycetes bacterium ADurb.Bin412]
MRMSSNPSANPPLPMPPETIHICSTWPGSSRRLIRRRRCGFPPRILPHIRGSRPPPVPKAVSASALSSGASGFATKTWSLARRPLKSASGRLRPPAAGSSKFVWTPRTANCWAVVRSPTPAAGRRGLPLKQRSSPSADRKPSACYSKARTDRKNPISSYGLRRWMTRIPPCGRSSRMSIPTRLRWK